MITSFQPPSGQVRRFLKIIFFLGSFGRVRLCRNRKTGEYFAMKILKKADIIKLKQVDHVISENTILADIDHPFLVKYFGKLAYLKYFRLD
jgi:serine/threonine protein kinase